MHCRGKVDNLKYSVIMIEFTWFSNKTAGGSQLLQSVDLSEEQDRQS